MHKFSPTTQAVVLKSQGLQHRPIPTIHAGLTSYVLSTIVVLLDVLQPYGQYISVDLELQALIGQVARMRPSEYETRYKVTILSTLS